jgi:hypothetical protein
LKTRAATPLKKTDTAKTKRKPGYQSGGQITKARIDIIRAIWFVLKQNSVKQKAIKLAEFQSAAKNLEGVELNLFH